MKPYTPIDLPINLPNEQDLHDYCVSKTMAKNPDTSNGIISIVGTMKPLLDWRTATDAHDGNTLCDSDTEHLVESHIKTLMDATTLTENVGSFYFEPEFDRKFPDLVEAIKKLPFKYLTGAFLLMSAINRDSNLHMDPYPLRDYPLTIYSAEPSRYNIQLNMFDENKFYLSKLGGDEKLYISVTREYPCFAFNNTEYYHGADSSDKHRLQLLIYGVLNEEEHQKLIKQSIEKFV